MRRDRACCKKSPGWAKVGVPALKAHGGAGISEAEAKIISDEPDIQAMISFDQRDAKIIGMFLDGWMKDDPAMNFLMASEEWEGIHFENASPEELANIFDSLTRDGFTQSVKRVFNGDHFYRSETAKCERCRRYRFELAYDKKRFGEDVHVCDRCGEALKSEGVAA